MSGCTKTYGRSHDLVRHLDTAHHAALDGAADDAILAAGVPPNQVARVRELIARRNACAVCGEAFSRRDALVRHMDEQGHRIVAPAPPAPVVEMHESPEADARTLPGNVLDATWQRFMSAIGVFDEGPGQAG